MPSSQNRFTCSRTGLALLAALLCSPLSCLAASPAKAPAAVDAAAPVNALVSQASARPAAYRDDLLPRITRANVRAMLLRLGEQANLGSTWNPAQPLWQKAEARILARLATMLPAQDGPGPYDAFYRQAVEGASPAEREEALKHFKTTPREDWEAGVVAETFILLQPTNFLGGKVPDADPDGLALTQTMQASGERAAKADTATPPPALVVKLRKIASMDLSDRLTAPSATLRAYYASLAREVTPLLEEFRKTAPAPAPANPPSRP